MTGKTLTSRDNARIENSPPLQGRGKGWGVSAGKLDQLQERGRQMRNEPTTAEKRLWARLSRSQLGGYKLRRQAVIGTAIADFLCPAKGLIVEIDGDTHTDPDADARRTARLEALGYHVVRVTNNDVMRNIEGVCDHLLRVLDSLPARRPPHPNPVDAAEVKHAPGMFEVLPGARPASTASTPEGEGLREGQKLLGISLEGSVG